MSLRRLLTLSVSSIGIAVLLVTVAFIASRMHKTYEMETKFSQLESLHHDIILKCTGTHDDVLARLDLLERVLFGEIKPKVDRTHPRPPVTRIEAAVLANERELRKRVEALERRLLRMLE